jgi:hypothetical protein
MPAPPINLKNARLRRGIARLCCGKAQLAFLLTGGEDAGSKLSKAHEMGIEIWDEARLVKEIG